MKKKNIIEAYNWLNEAFVHQTDEVPEDECTKMAFLPQIYYRAKTKLTNRYWTYIGGRKSKDEIGDFEVGDDCIENGNPITLHEFKDGKGFICFERKLRSLSKEAFRDLDHLYSITLPNDLESFGYGAFMNTTRLGCHEDGTKDENNNILDLTSFKNLKEIGDGCFHGCGATEIYLPDNPGLTTLGKNCFSFSHRLKVVKLPKYLTELNKTFNEFSSLSLDGKDTRIEIIGYTKDFIEECKKEGKKAMQLPPNCKTWKNSPFDFFYKSDLCPKFETLPTDINWTQKGLTFCSVDFVDLSFFKEDTIPSNFMTNVRIRHLVIPEGVEVVGKNAFGGCNISTLELPSTLKIVETMAFNLRGDVSTHSREDFDYNKLTIKIHPDTKYKFWMETAWSKRSFDVNSFDKVDIYVPHKLYRSFSSEKTLKQLDVLDSYHFRDDINVIEYDEPKGGKVVKRRVRKVNKNLEQN